MQDEPPLEMTVHALLPLMMRNPSGSGSEQSAVITASDPLPYSNCPVSTIMRNAARVVAAKVHMLLLALVYWLELKPLAAQRPCAQSLCVAAFQSHALAREQYGLDAVPSETTVVPIEALSGGVNVALVKKRRKVGG
jgi:hypothetical protein